MPTQPIYDVLAVVNGQLWLAIHTLFGTVIEVLNLTW